MEPSTPRRQIEELRDYLAAQVQFPEDTPTWSAAALTRFLDGQAPTLDAAFGLVRDRRKGRSLADATHAEWAPTAWMEYEEALRAGSAGQTETQIAAAIGRRYGLGGRDPANVEDSAVASELKRILRRYQPVIVAHWAAELSTRLGDAEVQE